MEDIFKKMNALMTLHHNFTNEIEGQVFKIGDMKLYPSEIQVLLTISAHEDCNMTEIAQILQMTKGSLAKTINKLEDKAIICKYKKNDNKKSVYYRTTDLGKEACRIHDRVHESFNIGPSDTFISFCNEHEAVLSEFIDGYATYVKDLEEVLKARPWEKE